MLNLEKAVKVKGKRGQKVFIYFEFKSIYALRGRKDFYFNSISHTNRIRFSRAQPVEIPIE